MNFCSAMMVRLIDMPKARANLIYIEFAFYVNKTGWRSRKEFMVYWEGTPKAFGKFLIMLYNGYTLIVLC